MKKLVIIFFNKTELLEDFLSALLEIGVNGATVLESEGMVHIISSNIPIFSGLRDVFGGTSPQNKTILTAVREEMVEKIAEVMEDICGSLDEPGIGSIVVLPVEKVYGLNI